MARLLLHPVALVFLCFALIGTPVNYRGGSAEAHPHMFLEFVLDATSGSFKHHHGNQPIQPQHDEDSHAHAHAHATGATGEHDTQETAQPTAGEGERFAPTVSAFVVGDVGQFAFVLPDHDLPQAGGGVTPVYQGALPLSGLAHAPIAPPPR